jgi:hypothetical protein
MKQDMTSEQHSEQVRKKEQERGRGLAMMEILNMWKTPFARPTIGTGISSRKADGLQIDEGQSW